MTCVSAATIAAYQATVYEIVPASAPPLRLRIGSPSSESDAILQAQNVTGAAIVTAYNPESIALCEAENRAAHENLLHATASYTTLPTCAVDPAGAWPPEPGLLVLGITADEAIVLGQQFRQNAIVWLAIGEAPKLVLLR